MSASTIKVVEPANIEKQLPELLAELLNGSGVIIIKEAFPLEMVAEARNLIRHYTAAETDKETHFLGASTDQINLQRRVWNLLNKGEVFEQMVQHWLVMKIVAAFLGDEFIMGSVAANRLMPGGPGQEPHIDYPYWDLYKRSSFPMAINSSFPLNCQATVMLDPFTPQSGATAFLPYSQGGLRYPDSADRERFFADAVRMEGDPGDCVIFNGMCWHAAMPNVSEQDRTGILIEYLPKFVTPLEDQLSGVSSEVVERATPMLRQLMAMDYPYPKLFDEAEATVQIGRDVSAS